MAYIFPSVINSLALGWTTAPYIVVVTHILKNACPLVFIEVTTRSELASLLWQKYDVPLQGYLPPGSLPKAAKYGVVQFEHCKMTPAREVNERSLKSIPHFACEAMHPMSGLYLPRGVAHENFTQGCHPLIKPYLSHWECATFCHLYKLLIGQWQPCGGSLWVGWTLPLSWNFPTQ